MNAFGAIAEDPLPRTFPIGSESDIVYRQVLGLKRCSVDFRREFLERGYGFYAPAGSDKTVFANFLDPYQLTAYYVLFHSNNGPVVHLSVNIYDTQSRPSPRLTQKTDVLWDVASNRLQAYVDPSCSEDALRTLGAIFSQAPVTLMTFQTLSRHYSIPDLSAYRDGVHAITFREWDASFVTAADSDGPPPTRERIGLLPHYIDPSFILHYAALCRHGWIHTGLCPFDYEYAYTMIAAPDHSLLTLRLTDATTTVAYRRCHVRFASNSYDPTTTVLRLDLTGCFEPPAPAPATPPTAPNVPFAVNFCWNLTHNVLYFPSGQLATSTRIGLPGGSRLVQSWVTSPKDVLFFLEELFIANVPNILWNKAYAVHFARNIVGRLPWLSAFRAATRDRLPDRVYHTMGMTEVPKGIRTAYQLGDVLPMARPRPVKRPRPRDPRTAAASA